MSSTSQAFEHWAEAKYLAEHDAEYRRAGYRALCGAWARRLPPLIREDFPVADHIRVRAMGPVFMECERCHESMMVSTSHMVGTFLDDHNQCSAPRVGWRCAKCHQVELDERLFCRVCEHPKTNDVVTLNHNPQHLGVMYQVWRHWPLYNSPRLVGSVSVSSLREALRMARAMLPNEQFHITLLPEGPAWRGDHEAR